uniref:Probable cytosolic iron-sulfur protein assembly protein CIAO1 homolog n=1 Tax=Syphacia muris TaxID=451379 RepID=A0A0N5AFW1_9BILA
MNNPSLDVNANLFFHSDNSKLPCRVWCVQWNHNGTLLASCGESKDIVLWKYTNESPYLRRLSSIITPHNRAIRKLAFSPNDRLLASAGFDAVVVVYREIDGVFKDVAKLEGHENEVKCCDFSISGQYMASCSRDKTVWIWEEDECEDFMVCGALQVHLQDVKYIKWHPYEEVLVSCSYDCSISFYRLDYDDDEWVVQQRVENAHDSTVWCCDFSSDGNFLVTVGADSHVKVWKRQEDSLSVAFSKWIQIINYEVTTTWPLYTVSWSPFDNLIAVGGGDSFLRCFEFSNVDGNHIITEIYSLRWRRTDINCLQWNPKIPKCLAAASDDGAIQVLSFQF